jgi:nucleoside phosphorylase
MWAILTPIAVEWKAVCARMANLREAINEPLPTSTGTLGKAHVVCILSGKGQANTASALQHVMACWQPRWIMLVGIAGGFPERGIRKGDVVVGNFIYGYDFGKLVKGRYVRRPEYDYSPDRLLLAHAELIAADPHRLWSNDIPCSRPDTKSLDTSAAHLGYIASGDKLIDDPDHSFFKNVRSTVPSCTLSSLGYPHITAFSVVILLHYFPQRRRNRCMWHSGR